jgi:predicted PurR-regulated permease PerM
MTPAISVPRSSVSQRIIAGGIVVGFLYIAGALVMTVVVSALFASTLEPMVRFLTRRRVPRGIAASLMVLLLLGAFYLFFYLFYAQGVLLVQNLPTYSERLREHVMRFRQKTELLQRQAQAVVQPRAVEGPELPPREEHQSGSPVASFLGSGLRSATEIFLLVSFVPFLVYFMLAWKNHLRRNAVGLFSSEGRMAAERMIDGITQMVNGFVVGNVIIGVVISLLSAAFFWAVQLPYAAFIGPLSGFLTLVPYFGVVLAMGPPVLAGLVHYNSLTPVLVLSLGVFSLHLFAINVLYPKIVGRRVHLNPVVVTLALMFWGWLWGGMGLILAVPITAAMKAVCDNVAGLRPYGRFMGD